MSTLRRRTGSIWTRSFKRNLSRIQLVAFVIEFILAIAAVIIHSIAYPESFRKTLWEIGGEAGWNSNPKLRIYFYANYRQPPEIPLLWTQRLSETNLSVALIATSVFFARLVLVFFDYAGSLCSILYDILLSALWLYSILAQSSGDLSDTEHLSLRPWYLEKGCYRVAPPYIHVCYIARSAFGISIVSLIFYVGRVIYSILWLAYWCGKHQMFDGGLKEIFHKYQHLYVNDDFDSVGQALSWGDGSMTDVEVTPFFV